MDLGAAVVTNEQSFVVVEPGEGALDDPTNAAEAGAVLGLATRDLRFDPTRAELTAVLVMVVAAVGDHTVGAPSWPAGLATHGGDGVQQRHELGDVVSVGGRHRPRQGQAARIYEEVVFDARPAAVDRARPDPRAPFFACA